MPPPLVFDSVPFLQLLVAALGLVCEVIQGDPRWIGMPQKRLAERLYRITLLDPVRLLNLADQHHVRLTLVQRYVQSLKVAARDFRTATVGCSDLP